MDAKSAHTIALIPCYNEEDTIGSLVHKSRRFVDEVVVVDDGSRDETAEIAQDAGATVLSHTRNRGKSAGIRTGFKYALANGCDYLVTIDGDGQHDPRQIPVLLDDLITNGHDVVIGTRYGSSTEMPLWRRVGKRVLDYATHVGGGRLTDSQCGFRAFNRKAMQSLLPQLNGEAFNVESEQLIRAQELGLGVSQARVACKYKDLDTSAKNPTSHGFSVLSYIIWLIAERRPLLFISVPGFILVLLGIFVGILTLQIYNQTNVFVIPYAIVTSMLVIIGALAMFMGLVLNVLPSIIRRARNEPP